MTWPGGVPCRGGQTGGYPDPPGGVPGPPPGGGTQTPLGGYPDPPGGVPGPPRGVPGPPRGSTRTPPPPCGQTDGRMEGQTLVKTLPSLVLRTRAVINAFSSSCPQESAVDLVGSSYVITSEISSA